MYPLSDPYDSQGHSVKGQNYFASIYMYIKS